MLIVAFRCNIIRKNVYIIYEMPVNQGGINMKRFALEKLIEWKNKPNRKPLIIRGARQVGKTWLMKEFGKICFEKVAYVNFDSNTRMQQVFDGEISIDRIVLAISAETGISIDAENTLLIFDEVQEVPKALSSLKYFCENAPEYAIVAAGSLLGVALHKGTSFPVGKVDFMDLYPLTFQEFLCALGEERFVSILQSSDTDMVTMFKSKYMDRLREYYYVGGMPEVVQAYIETKDFNLVREIQKNLLNYYQQDFSKHADISLVPRLNLVWNSVPMQLAKENKKFIYGQVRKGSRAKDFELAIQWLADAGIVYKVSRIKEPKMPLKFYEDRDAFKLFLLDCGLLACMTDASADQMLIGDNVFTEFKGAFTEQYVLQQLLALGLKPYYWSNTKTPSEIDFIIQDSQRVIPVEVKAEENVRARSLAQFIKDNPGLKGLRISMKGYVDQEWMENIPIIAIGTYFEK